MHGLLLFKVILEKDCCLLPKVCTVIIRAFGLRYIIYVHALLTTINVTVSAKIVFNDRCSILRNTNLKY